MPAVEQYLHRVVIEGPDQFIRAYENMARAQDSNAQAQERWNRMANQGALALAGLGAAATAFLAKGMQHEAMMERWGRSLAIVFGNTHRAAQEAQWAWKQAADTPFEPEQLLSGMASIYTGAQRGKVGFHELMQAAMDTAAGLNITGDRFEAFSGAVGMAAAGVPRRLTMMTRGIIKLAAEDFEEGGRYAGRTWGEALLQEMQRFSGGAASQGQGWSGSVVQLRVALEELAGTAAKPLMGPLQHGIEAVTEKLREQTEAGGSWLTWLTAGAAVAGDIGAPVLKMVAAYVLYNQQKAISANTSRAAAAAETQQAIATQANTAAQAKQAGALLANEAAVWGLTEAEAAEAILSGKITANTEVETAALMAAARAYQGKGVAAAEAALGEDAYTGMVVKNLAASLGVTEAEARKRMGLDATSGALARNTGALEENTLAQARNAAATTGGGGGGAAAGLGAGLARSLGSMAMWTAAAVSVGAAAYDAYRSFRYFTAGQTDLANEHIKAEKAVKPLVEQYARLADESKRGARNQKEMLDVLLQIGEQAPHLLVISPKTGRILGLAEDARAIQGRMTKQDISDQRKAFESEIKSATENLDWERSRYTYMQKYVAGEVGAPHWLRPPEYTAEDLNKQAVKLARAEANVRSAREKLRMWQHPAPEEAASLPTEPWQPPETLGRQLAISEAEARMRRAEQLEDRKKILAVESDLVKLYREESQYQRGLAGQAYRNAQGAETEEQQKEYGEAYGNAVRAAQEAEGKIGDLQVKRFTDLKKWRKEDEEAAAERAKQERDRVESQLRLQVNYWQTVGRYAKEFGASQEDLASIYQQQDAVLARQQSHFERLAATLKGAESAAASQSALSAWSERLDLWLRLRQEQQEAGKKAESDWMGAAGRWAGPRELDMGRDRSEYYQAIGRPDLAAGQKAEELQAKQERAQELYRSADRYGQAIAAAQQRITAGAADEEKLREQITDWQKEQAKALKDAADLQAEIGLAAAQQRATGRDFLGALEQQISLEDKLGNRVEANNLRYDAIAASLEEIARLQELLGNMDPTSKAYYETAKEVLQLKGQVNDLNETMRQSPLPMLEQEARAWESQANYMKELGDRQGYLIARAHEFDAINRQIAEVQNQLAQESPGTEKFWQMFGTLTGLQERLAREGKQGNERGDRDRQPQAPQQTATGYPENRSQLMAQLLNAPAGYSEFFSRSELAKLGGGGMTATPIQQIAGKLEVHLKGLAEVVRAEIKAAIQDERSALYREAWR